MKQSRRKDCNYRDQLRKRAPIDFEVIESMKVWAEEKAPGVDINTETETFMDCDNFPRGHMDWTGTWRNWMRREQKRINQHQSNRDFYAGKIQAPVTIEQTRKRIDQIAKDCGLPPGTAESVVMAANKRRVRNLLN